MVRLKNKLAIFNLVSKLVFTGLFLLFMPWAAERINLRQIDNDLINKRESFIDIISEVGIEPFISSDDVDAFGSYNILKDEFLSLERVDLPYDLNQIEVAARIIEDEEITYRVLNYTFRADGQMYLLEIGKSLESINQARRNISVIIYLLMGVIIFITFLTDINYNRFLLRPLDRITAKLKGISSPSLFDSRPVSTTTQDFQELDKALCELMANIDELFRKEKEITANISHELMTPVSVMRSKLENLLLKGDADNAVAESIEDSLKTLYRLQGLVNSLLMIARIESRQYLKEDNIMLDELLSEIVTETQPVANDKGVNIKEEPGDKFEFKKANRNLLFSMFYNVVNNAVKNTPGGGTVVIKHKSEGSSHIVVISDNGTGMTEEQLGYLFERFRSLKQPGNNGTGIGLAITKTIADFHNISISAESKSGKGTTFSFTIPENS